MIYFHNPQAAIQLPNTQAMAMDNASIPNVGRLKMICSLCPTSMPNKKSNNHIRKVIILFNHGRGWRRIKWPIPIPINIIPITINIIKMFWAAKGTSFS